MTKLFKPMKRGAWVSALVLGLSAGTFCLRAASPSPSHSIPAIDYEQPKLLVGLIVAPGDNSKKLLFKSQRTATRSGSTVRVVCDYTYPDGSLAARDRIVYEAGQLASFESEELQTGEKGGAVVRIDPENPGKKKIFFDYTVGVGDKAKKSKATESQGPENEVLVDDMIPGFIVAHWDTLMKGLPAKFRYIALSRKETVGFKLSKDSTVLREGKPVVRIKMEPTSIIIAQLVDPLFFVVEPQGAHRILEYIGRTTPMIRSGNKWKDLDAITIFE